MLEADKIGGPRAMVGTVASLEELLCPLVVPGGGRFPVSGNGVHDGYQACAKKEGH
jgi:hypothetical protein